MTSKKLYELPEKLLTTREVSDLTGLSEAYFERKRWLGEPPAYIKIGRNVRYDPAVIQNWLDAGRVE